MTPQNSKPKYDFSDEYISEEVDLGTFNGHPFIVTVQEIPHGKYTRLQQGFIGKMHLTDNEAAHKKQLEEKEVDPIEFVENRNFAGINKWTLRLKDGTPVDVCEEAWEALPHRLTEKIEKAIARVNPTMDKDFRAELVDSAGDMGKPDETKQAI
jgi:hypothetical protein